MPTRVAVFCHMFHADLFSEVARYLANIPVPADLYFSTSTEENWARLKELFPQATVEIVPNRGRDIAPKFITFASAHDGYDVVLHLHTKRSIPEWRTHLYDHLLGSPEIISTILKAFAQDERIGVIAPDYYTLVLPNIRWGGNKETAENVARKCGMANPLPDLVEFPAGSMFWARPRAIQPLLNAGLSYFNFPEEPIPDDGTLAHAIERLIFISALHAGFGWALVSDTSRPKINGPYFSSARPGWKPPAIPVPLHKQGNVLIRLARRLKRSYQKRLRHLTPQATQSEAALPEKPQQSAADAGR